MRRKYFFSLIVIFSMLSATVVSPLSPAQSANRVVSGMGKFEFEFNFDTYRNDVNPGAAWKNSVDYICLKLDGEAVYDIELTLRNPVSYANNGIYSGDRVKVPSCTADLPEILWLDSFKGVDFKLDTTSIPNGTHTVSVQIDNWAREGFTLDMPPFEVRNYLDPELELTGVTSSWAGEAATIKGAFNTGFGKMSSVELKRGNSKLWEKGYVGTGKFTIKVKPFKKSEKITIRAKFKNRFYYLVELWAVAKRPVTPKTYKLSGNFPKSMAPGATKKITFQIPGVQKARCRIRETGSTDTWFWINPKGFVYYTQGDFQGSGFVQCFWNNGTTYATISYRIPVNY
jgi:hypothetical protein